MHKLVFILFFTLAWMSINAQQYQKSDEMFDADGRPQKLGIKGGLNFTGMPSRELPEGQRDTSFATHRLLNPKLTYGLHVGAYYRWQISPRIHNQIELAASFRGSRFDNLDSNGYSRISLFYLDMPVLFHISLDKKKQNNLVIGYQASYLIRGQIFVGRDVLASFSQVPFKKWDHLFVGGYHFNFDRVGLNILLKYGIRNINNGFANFDPPGSISNQRIQDIRPSLMNVGDIRNYSIEFGISF